MIFRVWNHACLHSSNLWCDFRLSKPTLIHVFDLDIDVGIRYWRLIFLPDTSIWWLRSVIFACSLLEATSLTCPELLLYDINLFFLHDITWLRNLLAMWLFWGRYLSRTDSWRHRICIYVNIGWNLLLLDLLELHDVLLVACNLLVDGQAVLDISRVVG